MSVKKTISRGRRFFIKFMSFFGISINLTLIQSLLTGCETDTTKTTDETIEFDVSSKQSLSEVNGIAKVTFPEHNSGKPIFVVRADTEKFTVFSSVCTHLGCEVNLPVESGENLVCECHGSQFSPDNGEVLRGPAESSLRDFVSSYNPSTNTLKIWF